jgi:hypothetical protein
VKLFDRLLGKRTPKETPVDAVRKIIDRFTTATHAGVDAEDIGRYPHKQRKVMAFHFGAIKYLAQQYELDETGELTVFVMFIDQYFNLPVKETGSISELLESFESNVDEQEYLEAGLDVFKRWHEQNERRAPLQLGELLQRR